ncbi:hypothetical protein BD626DRAFT_509916 [Schizophyllum amplum]|uniref:Uncharacterized protein n=1 Tax=Schizophyllum amplum TaxID=97359 RepID=A0A550C260_9AGAR|nr:hypothetical protein BD626DRAFT_509916 [Auriculariopsis ampla]
MTPSQVALALRRGAERAVKSAVGLEGRLNVSEWRGWLESRIGVKRLRWMRGRAYEVFAVEAVAPQVSRVVDDVLEGAARDAEGSGWERNVPTEASVSQRYMRREGMVRASSYGMDVDRMSEVAKLCAVGLGHEWGRGSVHRRPVLREWRMAGRGGMVDGTLGHRWRGRPLAVGQIVADLRHSTALR